MKQILRSLSFGILACVVLFSDAGPAASADDKTGTLVLTMNTPTIDGQPVSKYYLGIFINYRRRDGSEDKSVGFTAGFWGNWDGDFGDNGSHGLVEVLTLGAGDWEVYSFKAFVQGGSAWPKQSFSIPFTIKPGRTTYIGNIQPIGCFYRSQLLGFKLPGAVRMLVTDRSAHDVQIALRKKPDLDPVDIDVFNVDALGNPLLMAHDPLPGMPEDVPVECQGIFSPP